MASKKPVSSEALEEQDQSIKARKNQLFDAANPNPDAADNRPFSAYLKETPGTPLTPGLIATFWGIGILIALLFLAAILGGPSRKPRRSSGTSVQDTSTRRLIAMDGENRILCVTSAPGLAISHREATAA